MRAVPQKSDGGEADKYEAEVKMRAGRLPLCRCMFRTFGYGMFTLPGCTKRLQKHAYKHRCIYLYMSHAHVHVSCTCPRLMLMLDHVHAAHVHAHIYVFVFVHPA